jgi:hypothetical protein
VDGHVTQMIAHRKAAIASLARARATQDASIIAAFAKLIHEWDVTLAVHGVGPDV